MPEVSRTDNRVEIAITHYKLRRKNDFHSKFLLEL